MSFLIKECVDTLNPYWFDAISKSKGKLDAKLYYMFNLNVIGSLIKDWSFKDFLVDLRWMLLRAVHSEWKLTILATKTTLLLATPKLCWILPATKHPSFCFRVRITSFIAPLLTMAKESFFLFLFGFPFSYCSQAAFLAWWSLICHQRVAVFFWHDAKCSSWASPVQRSTSLAFYHV